MSPTDSDKPSLFDLPLQSEPATDAEEQETVVAQPATRVAAGGGYAPLLPFPEGEAEAVETPAAAADEQPEPAGDRATLRARLTGFLLDTGALSLVLAISVAALAAMEIPVERSHWPALGLFALIFSFYYQVLPLGFWGKTPGMAVARLEASPSDAAELTFRQAKLRWLAFLAELATLGLLGLVALSGRSLADRWSDSETRVASAPRRHPDAPGEL